MERAHQYPYASLTAGLLARKGEAAPAMESFDPNAPISQKTVNGLDGEAQEAPKKPARRPSETAAAARRARVSRRAASIASGRAEGPERLRAAAEDAECETNCADKFRAPAAGATARRRAAVTIRLTTHDFMRLKLASAELGMTSQDILTRALETYLDAHEVESLSDCVCLRRAAEKAEAAAAAADRGGPPRK